MDLLTLFTIGVLTGHAASLLNSYSLGAIGNSLLGLICALFLSNHLSTMFELSRTMGLVAGGLVGATVILAVFNAAESFRQKKHHLF